jgi:beta-lactamase regulating signal transducer with metallopeptidase domain
MQSFLESAGVLLTWLGRASWQASVLILLVLLAQWLLRGKLAPRWRHGLWLLVVMRLALPWTPESRISLFNWLPMTPPAHAVAPAGSGELLAAGEELAPRGGAVLAATASVQPIWRTYILWTWLIGVVALPFYLLLSNLRLGARVRRRRPVTNSAVLELLEDCKQEMAVGTPLTLIETPAVGSPSLFGFVRPRLLLPAGFTQSFSAAELRHVFLHELGHVKRGDIPLNWLTTGLLILHWFNPFVWYAFNRMQADRELACDALALSRAKDAENQSYGQTMIKLLETFCRPARSPGMVGILENQNQMKRRISMIAKFKKSNRWPVAAMAAFAALALVALTDAQSAPGAADEQGPPTIVSTSPKVGETDVDPTVAEITVTFDRDMGSGFSWTGGGPEYPPAAEGKKAQWRDKRTCVMPVKLEAGHYYRVGINSKSFQNFKSAKGVPALPSAIYFTTKGASEDLKARTSKPQIVELVPKNGAQDVNPKLAELRVTFSVPMGRGLSWVGGGPEFPKTPEGKKAYWTEDQKTCVLPVQLEPGRNYRLGLNSQRFMNFQSASGVPLDPVSYSFRTKAE